MKKYQQPIADLVSLSVQDVIAASVCSVDEDDYAVMGEIEE